MGTSKIPGVGHARYGRPDKRHNVYIASMRTALELSRSTGLTLADCVYILEELSDVMVRQLIRSEPVGIPNLGILFADPPATSWANVRGRKQHKGRFRLWKRVIDGLGVDAANGGRFKSQMAKIREVCVRTKNPDIPGNVERIENYLEEYAYLRQPGKKRGPKSG
jgi:hypothetical protein